MLGGRYALLLCHSLEMASLGGRTNVYSQGSSLLTAWLSHRTPGAQEAARTVNSHRYSDILLWGLCPPECRPRHLKKYTEPAPISTGAQTLGLGPFLEASIFIPWGECSLIHWLAEGSEMSPRHSHSDDRGELDLKGTGPWHYSLTDRNTIEKGIKILVNFSVSHTFTQSNNLGYMSFFILIETRYISWLCTIESPISWEALRFRGKILAFGVRALILALGSAAYDPCALG